MINFDFYEYNPTTAATLIAKNGYCAACLMCGKCDSAQTHENVNKCFDMWESFFKGNPETLESEEDFAKILEIMIDCDKCPVAKENECDYNDAKGCALTFVKWLCKDISTCQESRQVEEESDSVNHPDHYMLIDGVEVIDVINEILTRSNYNAQQGYYYGNVIKYILRADKKNGVEDLEKAEVYLNWLIESMQGGEK